MRWGWFWLLKIRKVLIMMVGVFGFGFVVKNCDDIVDLFGLLSLELLCIGVDDDEGILRLWWGKLDW